MSNGKVKDLGIKLLVAWTQESPKKNSGTELGFFPLAAQAFNGGLKALLRTLLSFGLAIFQLFVLCISSICKPAKETSKGTKTQKENGYIASKPVKETWLIL